MISLLVPTMNRSDFLIRLLHYYHRLGFKGCICIGDSSNQEHVARARLAISRYRDRLNIIYQEHPGLNNAQCIHLMLQKTATPYAAFVADDDFLVPRALERCAKFLQENPGYSAAHGVGIALQLETSGPYGRLKAAWHYDQAEIGSNTAAERLAEYEGRPAGTQFSLHTTESWRIMYREVTTVRDVAFGTEIIPCYLTVMLGKVKSLEGLYLIRQIHDQQYIYRSEPADWIMSPDWEPSFDAYCKAVGDEMARMDGTAPEQARERVRVHYRRRVDRMLKEGEAAAPTLLRRAYSRLARLGGVVRRAGGGARGISLASLSKPSSPHHADFMDIRQAVTAPPDE